LWSEGRWLLKSNSYCSNFSAIASVAKNKSLIKSNLSGLLDSFTLQAYKDGGGELSPQIISTGKHGRVVCRFEIGSGAFSTVNLGGNLTTGYVVSDINDPLGLFPAGTVQGDFLDNGVIKQIFGSGKIRIRTS
jgi:hypothetical protein